tara:strand:- start:314 stop:1132 length:819 start_codon:yes stop_codon:yes gene_type:complete
LNFAQLVVEALMLVIAAAVAAGALQLPEPFSLSDPATTLSHYFSPTANWLVPRHVLVGRYPGSCPSRYLDEATQSERITLLRTIGRVRTFVCLQSELPPQDLQDGPGSWEHVAPAGGAKASFRPTRGPRASAGFRPYYADAFGISGPKSTNLPDPEFVQFRIPDSGAAPSLKQLAVLVTSLGESIRSGKVLYLHCWEGRGRVGLVGACLLGELYPCMGANEAMQRVQAYLELRDPRGRSPETEEQREQVRAYFATYIEPRRAGQSGKSSADK